MRSLLSLAAAIALTALPACGSFAYHRGSLPQRDGVAPAAVRPLGCLDVGFALRPDAPSCAFACGAPLPVLEVHVGNACGRPARFDLAKLRVVARDAGGAAMPLSLVDPRGEIVPLHVDARAHGVEHVRLATADAELVPRTICIDPSGTVGVPAPPICLSRSPYGAWEVQP